MLEYENEMFLSALQVKCGKTKAGVKISRGVCHRSNESLALDSVITKLWTSSANLPGIRLGGWPHHCS